MERRKILWLVPARGGSKGIVGKNLRRVGGIPLVARATRTCRAAARSLAEYDHEVLCSTDAADIAEVARQWGATVPFSRPAILSTDEADSVDVTLHAIDWHIQHHGREPDVVVLVQATSPLTRPSDLIGVLRVHAGSSNESAVTVNAGAHAVWSYHIEDGRLVPLSAAATATRRQEAKGVVELNGAAFAAAPGFLRKHRRFVVDHCTKPSLMDSRFSIDVDSEEQLLICESVLRAQPPRPLSIGARTIGLESPCYVIAEVGVNHNGDIARAHRLVDVAADAGADAVKFQTFDPKKLAAAEAPTAEYQKAAARAPEGQRAMLEALALSRQAHRELMTHSRERGIQFLSSPFDEGSADFLLELDVPAFKIPSGEITNLPLLRHIARFGRPMLVSSGMSDMVEVAEAMDAIEAGGSPEVALFHCVSNYPATPSSSNLRAMESLAAAFGVPVGWSDHTMGIDISLAATAMGARLLEKHVTTSRKLEGPDHSASLEPDELAALVRGVRAIESALGDGIKEPFPEEIPIRKVARKSLHWTDSLPVGHVISRQDVACLRPGHGLTPACLDGLIGKPLLRPAVAGAMVAPGDVARGDQSQAR